MHDFNRKNSINSEQKLYKNLDFSIKICQVHSSVVPRKNIIVFIVGSVERPVQRKRGQLHVHMCNCECSAMYDNRVNFA